MTGSIYEQLIGELLIDPVRVSREIKAELDEMRNPPTREIVLPVAGWPSLEGRGPA